MPNVQFSDFIPVETSATATESSSPFKVSYISLISNDGTDSIIFNFCGGSTTGAKAFTLKPGEQIADIYISANVLYYRAASGTQAFRAWGFN